MKWTIQLILWLVILLLASGSAQGQYVTPYDPYAPAVLPTVSAKERRALRDRAAVHIGTPAAKAFIERFGEDAVKVVNRCTVPVSRQLAEFHAAGGLSKLKYPNDLVRAIGDGGDPVAKFILTHPELADEAKSAAFLGNPEEYVYELLSLDAGAAQLQAQRSNPGMNPSQTPTETQEPMGTGGWRIYLIAMGVVGIACLLWWRFKRRQSE